MWESGERAGNGEGGGGRRQMEKREDKKYRETLRNRYRQADTQTDRKTGELFVKDRFVISNIR